MNRELRKKRHFRIRKHLLRTKACPRLSVFRSNKYIYAQIIDDTTGQTLAAAQSNLKASSKESKIDQAYQVGKKLAEIALKKGIKKVVFDRGGFLYHGRVEKLAIGAREGGLKF